MSLEALNRAWKSNQPGTKKLILLALANVADEWGYVYASGEYLAKVCNVGLRSIRRGIKDLREANEIRLVARGGGRAKSDGANGERRGEANVYQVIIGLSPETIAESEKLSELAIRALANGVKMALPNGAKLAPHTLINNAADINQEREAAALRVKGAKMTPLLYLVDKIDHEENNLDNLTPLPKEQVQQIAETALAAGWGGELDELARLLVDAARAERLNYPYGLQDALDDAQAIGWRGSNDNLIRAWLQEPGRVENLIWYARQKSWGGGLLRRALQSGEWPPELMPGSEAAQVRMVERYLQDPYAEFYE